MNKGRKYDTSGLVENQFEPGSRGQVLKNLLGIKKKKELDRIEASEQLRALDEIVKFFDEDHSFTAADICRVHKIWLGRVYAWAGQYRQVNISKGGFPFAAVQHVPHLMQEFEKGPLQKFTPCRFDSIDKISKAMAVVHAELVLIHPFRDGNGRLARLLSIVMGWQAKLPTLDFGVIAGQKKTAYFAAVRKGLTKDYKPMEQIFRSVLRRTLAKTKK